MKKEKTPNYFTRQKDYIYVASILDIRRKNQDNEHIVRTRVTCGKEQKYFQTGSKMSLKDWLRMPKAKEANLVEMRRSIEASNNVVYGAVKRLCELNSFTFERLTNLLGRGSGNSVNALFERKIEDLRENGQLTSANFYRGVLNSFVCFKCGKTAKEKKCRNVIKKA